MFVMILSHPTLPPLPETVPVDRCVRIGGRVMAQSHSANVLLVELWHSPARHAGTVFWVGRRRG